MGKNKKLYNVWKFIDKIPGNKIKKDELNIRLLKLFTSKKIIIGNMIEIDNGKIEFFNFRATFDVEGSDIKRTLLINGLKKPSKLSIMLSKNLGVKLKLRAKFVETLIGIKN